MICRVCLKEAVDILQMFEERGQKLDIAQILRKHFWFEPTPGDPISTVICDRCWEKVSAFHDFYRDIERAHYMFFNNDTNAGLFEANIKSDCVESPYESQMPEQMEFALEIKQEFVENGPKEMTYLTDVVTSKMELNPLEDVEATSVTISGGEKVKTKTMEQTSECSSTMEDMEMLKPITKLESPRYHHVRKTRKTKIASCKVATSKTLRNFSKDIISVNNENSSDEAASKQKEQSKKRHKILSVYDESLIKKHISMGCELCPYVAENFADMTQHFRVQHENLKPYVICCGRKLNKRFLIVQHAYKHEDPEYYKCKDCNKVFSDGYVLRSHIIANHATEDELTYNCDQCPKKFSRRYLLELHKPSHIPVEDRKFWCKKCPQPKVFASDHLLQIHTNMCHTKAPNVCHVCAKAIRDNQAFEKHVRLHFEDSGPRVKCPFSNCDRWLKDVDNLKQHIRRHNDEGKTYICNECGKMCKNRRSLRSHINYAHTNETYSCEECNKTFKKAITLREHMAQHTGETLYKCPFCTRTFNSNANMHSHKKKIHPKEWDIWRKTKKGSSQQFVNTLNMDEVVKVL